MVQKKIEDSILKQASELFSKELLPYFGIQSKVTAVEPTGLVTITLNRQSMDYNYLLDEDIIYHFEFQSTDITVADCRRFRSYEALMSMKKGKAVITHVIYSGNVRKPVSEFKDGINTYKMDVIALQSRNADKVMAQLAGKAGKGIPLALIPARIFVQNARKHLAE